MDNSLMKVTQLPVIEEHLRSRKEQTEQRVAEAMSLVCTDETLTSVKNIRAEMNREFADAETQRKAIKAAIMEKYDSFESVYRECIADPYKRADADLKAKIDATESEIKSRCEEMLLGYFGSCARSTRSTSFRSGRPALRSIWRAPEPRRRRSSWSRSS